MITLTQQPHGYDQLHGYTPPATREAQDAMPAPAQADRQGWILDTSGLPVIQSALCDAITRVS